MILGIDVSTYLEQQRLTHQKYYKNGKEVDPFALFKENGVSIIRGRIWNNPYDEEGNPYLGGTNDVDSFIELAKKLKGYGFHYIVDFHYSDFWADPSKQFLPKSWRNLSYEQLLIEVYNFTKESLLKIKANDIDVVMVQIGNEITHGVLWPFGKLLGEKERSASFDRYAEILNSGIKASSGCHPVFQVYHREKIK